MWQGGCGAKSPAIVRVGGAPAGFVLALAWGSAAAPAVDVVAVCSALPTKVDLRQAYPGARVPSLLSYTPQSLCCCMCCICMQPPLAALASPVLCVCFC
jgi:hypothetical protein